MTPEVRWLYQMVIPLLACLAGSTAVFAAGILLRRDWYIAAWVISFGGTFAVLGANVVWIVFVDSKKRWPNRTAFDRFANLITFSR
jgi:hypothetical protein